MTRHASCCWISIVPRDCWWLVPLALVATCLLGRQPANLWAAPPEGDVILSALEDELQRSMALRLNDLESPYFVQYAVDDTLTYRLSATYGALVSTTQNRARTLHAQVRVGSYELDNSNFLGRGGFGGARGLSGSAELPTDQDYTAVRRAVWLATDALYKGSVATLAQKRAYLRDRNPGERPRDFTKVDAPANAVRDAVAPLAYSPQWETYVRDVSTPFATYAHLQDADVNLVVGAETRYLVNSEGCKLRYGETGAALRITAEALAPDGERLSDTLTYFAELPEQLPKLDAVLEDVRKFADRLAKSSQAPILDDYTGPVLVDGEAAGQLIRQLLAQGLTSQVEPVGLPRRNDSLGDDLESRLGKRILPTDIRIYDDPSQMRFQDVYLAGHYFFDDEGIAPQRVEIVTEGKLQGMATSRTPDKPFDKSNGHGRRGGGSTINAAIGCLYVESSQGASPEELKQELIDAADAEGLKFGLRVASLRNRSGFAGIGLPGFGRRLGGGGPSIGDPIEIYKVHVADGREELVRGCQFAAVDVRSLRRIIAAGKKQTVHNTLGGTSPGSSVIAPALLFEELELSRIKQEFEKKPILAAPHARPRPAS